MNSSSPEPEAFLSKRYSVLLCYLIIAIDERVKDCTLEQLYSIWSRSRPSRSVFINLINEMEELGWISKTPGPKRSARNLVVDQNAMRKALLISPQQDMSRGWLFDKGVFDDSLLQIHKK